MTSTRPLEQPNSQADKAPSPSGAWAAHDFLADPSRPRAQLVFDLLLRASLNPLACVEYAAGTPSALGALWAMRGGHMEPDGPGRAKLTQAGWMLLTANHQERPLTEEDRLAITQYLVLVQEVVCLQKARAFRRLSSAQVERAYLATKMLSTSPWVFVAGHGFCPAESAAIMQVADTPRHHLH